MKIYPHNELSNCDLIIDAIYEGGIKTWKDRHILESNRCLGRLV